LSSMSRVVWSEFIVRFDLGYGKAKRLDYGFSAAREDESLYNWLRCNKLIPRLY
jgi:hypothetical protein